MRVPNIIVRKYKHDQDTQETLILAVSREKSRSKNELITILYPPNSKVSRKKRKEKKTKKEENTR